MTSRKWITIIVLVAIIAAGAYWIYYSRNVSANISDKDLITCPARRLPGNYQRYRHSRSYPQRNYRSPHGPQSKTFQADAHGG